MTATQNDAVNTRVDRFKGLFSDRLAIDPAFPSPDSADADRSITSDGLLVTGRIRPLRF